MKIIDCALLGDIPKGTGLHEIYADDAEHSWVAHAQQQSELDLSVVYRLNGVIWVPVIDTLAKQEE